MSLKPSGANRASLPMESQKSSLGSWGPPSPTKLPKFMILTAQEANQLSLQTICSAPLLDAGTSQELFQCPQPSPHVSRQRTPLASTTTITADLRAFADLPTPVSAFLQRYPGLHFRFTSNPTLPPGKSLPRVQVPMERITALLSWLLRYHRLPGPSKKQGVTPTVETSLWTQFKHTASTVLAAEGHRLFRGRGPTRESPRTMGHCWKYWEQENFLTAQPG